MDADLTLRRDSSGGRIRRRPAATNKYRFQQLRRIILVHGFNTKEDGALDSYDKFTTYSTVINRSFGDQLLTLAWPGDRWVVNPVGYYQNNIKSAEECARALAAFISECNRHEHPCEYVFIAHSLGCRLVVLLLDELNKHGVSLKQFKIFLMAAAVPVDLLRVGSSLRKAVGGVSLSAVLHSPDDWVLQSCFRAGEPGGFWNWPQAVGLYGNPRDGLWTVEPELMPGFGHNYYWAKSDAAKFIARQLGFAVDRPIEERRMRQLALPERDELDARGLAAWQHQFATMAVDIPESAAHAVSLSTRSQDIAERLHARGDITGAQYDAARRFYAHWFLAGLADNFPPRHQDYVDRLAPPPRSREQEIHYSECHGNDLTYIGPVFSPIAQAVLLEDRDLEGVGELYLQREGRRARESVIDILRACLEALARHYG